MKASGNGMDLLQQMMLPRVQVDLLNNEIKATGNGVVQVRINGVKVEQDEIKALNPSDIIRIEYHDNLAYVTAMPISCWIILFAGRIREVVLVWTWRKVSIPCGVNIMLGERSIIRTRNGALLIGSVLVISME